MTGKGILEALSFVDEKYIEEAESGTLRRNSPFVRVLLPLAACFCLVFLALFQMGQTAPTESMASEQEAGVPETICHEKSDSAMYGQNDIALDVEAPEAGTQEVPSVILRIVQWTEDGFTATVEKQVDSDIFPVGTLLRVEIKSNICIETYSGDLVTVERRSPAEPEFPAGTLVRVQFDRYSQEENTIRIETIAREEE